MQESMYKYMKIGLVHAMAYPTSVAKAETELEYITKTACDPYFNAIEIQYHFDSDLETREKIKKILDSSHMTVAYAGQPRIFGGKLNLNSLDEAERAKAIEACKISIDHAAYFGAIRCAFVSGKEPGKDKHAAAIEALIDSLKQLSAYAQTKNLEVALETFDYDVDKKCLIGPSVEAGEMARKIRKNYPNFGLMLDLSHLPLLKESSKHAVEAVKDVLIHAHIGNCVMQNPSQPAYGDMHPGFGFAGGENDVPQLVEYLRALMEAGYLDGKTPRFVSFEVKPWGDESDEVVLTNAKRTLNEAWAQL